MLVFGAAVAGSCKQIFVRGPVVTRQYVAPAVVTPAPSWASYYAALGSDSLKNVTLADSVVGYGRTLEFDTVDGAGDEQPLWVGTTDSGHFGPVTRIEPQRGSYLLDSLKLQTGRVIARIINRSADSGYAPLRMLPKDTVYWWIERRNGAWISAFVRTQPPSQGILVDSLQRTTHADGQWKQALARWVDPAFAYGTWIDCSSSGCCSATAPRIAAATLLKP
jgi:hypothetical protein